MTTGIFFDGDRTSGRTPTKLFGVCVKNKLNGLTEDGKKPRLQTEFTMHKTKAAAEAHFKSAQKWLYDDESVELMVAELDFQQVDKATGVMERKKRS